MKWSSSLSLVSNSAQNFPWFKAFRLLSMNSFSLDWCLVFWHNSFNNFHPVPSILKPNNILSSHKGKVYENDHTRMCGYYDSYLKVALSGECFLTDCTSERLVPRMGAHVYLQCRWRWEVLIANMAQVLWQACKHTHNTPSDQAACIH